MFKRQYQRIVVTVVLGFIIIASNVLATNIVNAQQSQSKFLWGTATASYQSEGEIYNNDLDMFTRSSVIQDRVTSNTELVNDPLHIKPAIDAVKFNDPGYYGKDFNNAVSMGMNTFRIGIEWASIEPQNNQWNLTKIEEYSR